MKMMKRLSVILLSFGMMLMLTAPALAVPSGSYAVLNVKYAPNGSPVNGVVYSLYKVADAKLTQESRYLYTLTEDFAGSGIDINAIMEGRQVTDSTTQRQLLALFGTYINEHEIAGAIESATAEEAIGTQNMLTAGVAQFTGLSDGLYLGSTNAAARFGNMQYTAVPFLLNIPYTVENVTYNYITVGLKYVVEDLTPDEPDPPVPPSPTPDIPDQPQPTTSPRPEAPDPTPDNPLAASPEPAVQVNPNVPIPEVPAVPETVTPDSPVLPETPEVPEASAVPDTPSPDTPVPETPETLEVPEEPEIEILPDEVPLTDAPDDLPEIEVPDDEVPLSDGPGTPPEGIIPDDEVPLAAKLPQTGLLWWPVPLMAAGGIACVGLGAYSKKKADRDE